MGEKGRPPKPNRRLTRDAVRLPISVIPKWGVMTVEWPQNLARAVLTRASPTLAVISMGGVETEIELRSWAMPTVKFRQRGIRTRMVCPRCGASRDALHWIDGAWGCRGLACGNLAYACRHRQRYCTAIARRARLLRKLVRVPPRSLQARLLREQIAQQESLMLAHLQRVNRDVTKRRQRYGRRVDISERAG